MTSNARSIGKAFAALALVSAAVAGALVPGCANPVVDAQILALGGEAEGVEEGPFHRPGQPCLLCHSPYGGAPEFAVGGTVFADQKGASFKTVEDVEVVLTDSIGVVKKAVTNCVGNFYIFKEQWNPQFPLAAEIRFPVYDPATGEKMMETIQGPDGPEERVVRKVKAMGSYISRDGSCGSCHSIYGNDATLAPDGVTPLFYNSAGWIYCNGSGDGVAPPDNNFFPEFDPLTCGGKLPRDASQTTAASSGTGP